MPQENMLSNALHIASSAVSNQGAGWPSKTGEPSGGGRDNNPPKPSKRG